MLLLFVVAVFSLLPLFFCLSSPLVLQCVHQDGCVRVCAFLGSFVGRWLVGG